MSTTPIRLRPASAGFALPAVLVVVGMLALVFLVAVSALDTLARETAAAKRGVEFQQAALSLEAKAAFLAATEPLGEDTLQVGGPRAESRSAPAVAPSLFGREGVTPLHLDGRRYAAAGGRFWLSLQDGAGQINLDQLTPDGRDRLAALIGVALEQRAVLLDRLADDMDPDDLKRLRGAEAADYAAAGLAPPRNRPFTSPAEALGVLGWRALVPRRGWAALRDEVAADPAAGDININTASPTALEVILGLTPDQARAAVDARTRAPFTSMAGLTAIAGPLPYDAERTYTRPGGRFALKAADPRAGLVYRSRIVLTPQGLERPLWIDERSLTPATDDDKSALSPDAPRFPDPAH